jgi:hypothetical protein
VRDTIARQSDVDENSIKYEIEPGKKSYANGTITFLAQKGKSIDLRKLHESLTKTRLFGGTRSAVNFLEITARGEVVAGGKETSLKVSGSTQFILADDSKAKPKEGTKTPYQRLKDALAKGAKITHVTGRVQGWSGRWPDVLRELAEKDKPDQTAKKPPLLMVTDFQTE